MLLTDGIKAALMLAVLAGGAIACGSAFSADSRGEGGADGDSANGTGGTSGVDGGAQACVQDTDCVVAANFADPCFSPSCSLPVAASRVTVEGDACLVPWEQRFSYSEPPPGCTVLATGVPCSGACAEQPACVEPRCETNGCRVRGDDAGEACEGVASGGSGAGGSSSGTGGSSSEYDCDSLDAERQALLEQAAGCDLESGVSECSGGTTVPDACGCPQVISDFSDVAAQAQEAYNRWVNAGCRSEPCPGECVVVPTASCQAHDDGARCDWGN